MIRYYSTLLKNNNNNGLLDNYSEYNLQNKILIARETINGFEYTVFNTVAALADYYIKQEKHYFHETILSFRQKMRFDIDIDLNRHNISLEKSWEIVESVIDSLIKVLHLSINDVVICHSMGDDNNREKISYHIITRYVCLEDHREARYTYDQCLKLIPSEYHIFIDNVYKKRCNFRMLYSYKRISEERVKRIIKTFTYRDEKVLYKYSENPENEFHKIIMELQDTLITFTIECRVVSRCVFDETPKEVAEISDIVVSSIVNYLSKKIDMSSFIFDKYHQGFILYKRIAPSYCTICYTTHDNISPYVYILEDRVYLNCRRHKSSLYVGKLQYADYDIILSSRITDFSIPPIDEWSKNNKFTRKYIIDKSLEELSFENLLGVNKKGCHTQIVPQNPQIVPQNSQIVPQNHIQEKRITVDLPHYLQAIRAQKQT